MIAMGYAASVCRKALLQVKNESVPAALDAIEGILE